MRGAKSRNACAVSSVSGSLKCRWLTTTATAPTLLRDGTGRKPPVAVDHLLV
jgi:hypothetical protein